MKDNKEKDIQFEEKFLELNIPPLFNGEIHVWSLSLITDTPFYERCKSALTATEHQRISYFNFKQVQDSYIISQGGLRLLLSFYLNIEPSKIQINKHSKGKPYTADDTSLCFNISNSGNYVIFAISRAGEVGIDIEKLRTLPDLNELIEKNFSSKEKQYISKNTTLKELRFFKFWTVKEAYLKAIGEGMRLPPSNLEFTIENGKYELDSVMGVFENEEWQIADLPLSEGYTGTLVYKNENTVISNIFFVK